MDDILKDERFSHIVSDPRYKRIPKLERKVKIDKRFQSMFTDKRFTVKYTVDKRGRPVSNTAIEDLRRYYDISSDNELDDFDDDAEDKEKCKIISKKKSTASLKEDKILSRVFSKKNKTVKKNKLPNKVVSGSESDGKPGKKSEHYGKVKLAKPVGKSEINNELEDSVSHSDSDYSEDSVESGSALSESLLLEAEERLQVDDKAKAKLRDLAVDYARGEGQLTSSSSDDDSDDESDDELDHGWGELDQTAELTNEATRRLALCNMDWDRIRASDLMVLFNSFLPQNGLIKSIMIYPSEFGLQRMKEEEIHGPPELRGNGDSGVFVNEEESREEEENEEGNDYHMEKLRQYQLNRLKYFYAVIDCDSEATANKLYTDCDGLEYESSASRFDLRFIPDDMTFDHKPREVCDSLPEMTKYQPRFFTTTALQQSKVQLTWDETNLERTEIAQKVMSGDVDRAELRTYLATSSSDEEEDAEREHERDHVKDDLEESRDQQDDKSDNDPDKSDSISKYKALLRDIEEEEEHKKNRGVEMEVSWGIGLKDKAAELARKKMKEQDELTPFQQFLEKRKEKRKQKKLKKKNKLAEDGEENPYSDDDIPSDIDMSDPYFKEEFENFPKQTKKQKGKKEQEENEETLNYKAELELLLLNESDSKKHFNFKEIQEKEIENKKKKKKKQKKKLKKAAAADVPDNIDFEVNVKDDRFEALFTSHHFNIDPADPRYHATKGMELLRSEKLKRRQQEDDHTLQPPGKAAKNSVETKQDADVTSLVKKVRLQTKFLTKIV